LVKARRAITAQEIAAEAATFIGRQLLTPILAQAALDELGAMGELERIIAEGKAGK
jgi:hypothetical protein